MAGSLVEWLTPGVMIAVFSLVFGVYVKINETRLGDLTERMRACELARETLASVNVRKDERILELEHEKVHLTTQLVEALVRVTEKVPTPKENL